MRDDDQPFPHPRTTDAVDRPTWAATSAPSPSPVTRAGSIDSLNQRATAGPHRFPVAAGYG